MLLNRQVVFPLPPFSLKEVLIMSKIDKKPKTKKTKPIALTKYDCCWYDPSYYDLCCGGVCCC